MDDRLLHQAEAAAAKAERRYQEVLIARYVRAFDAGDFAVMNQVFEEAAGNPELETLLYEAAEELARDDIEEVRRSAELQAQLHAAMVQLRLRLRGGQEESGQ